MRMTIDYALQDLIRGIVRTEVARAHIFLALATRGHVFEARKEERGDAWLSVMCATCGRYWQFNTANGEWVNLLPPTNESCERT